MKKRQLQDETFEEFLQESVKGHRMYPSDQVWNRIRTDIHGNRSWPALTFISLFIISALTLSTLLNNQPNDHRLPLTPLQSISAPVEATLQQKLTPDEKNYTYLSSIAPDKITLTTIAALQTVTSPEQNSLKQPQIDQTPVIAYERTTVQPLKEFSNTILPSTTTGFTAENFNSKSGESILLEGNPTETENTATINSNEALHQLAAAKGNTQQTADDFFRAFPFTGNGPVKSKSSRIGFQFFATSSVSYRRLTDTKLREINLSTNAANLASNNLPISSSVPAGVNDIVRHRPAVGWEIGFNVLYSISRKLQLTTGVQINLRRYDIETFVSRTSDLSSLSLINNRGIETISFYSPYNNNNGYRATILHNDLYQFSAPVGIQWKMVEGKKWGLIAEASVQPTLSLKANTWLVSADYKHYTEGNELLRKWNINSAAGFQVTYAGKNAILGVGPQIRYQHLPTYSNLYPIRENLIDYGIRLSITRPYRK